MNNIPKVSVIIPVYGVENYIERCARSLFEQTLDDIEYLFVNDCTPDRSIDILMRVIEDYPERKNQVRIITMERNSGQAVVRCKGILEAGGEYMIHCDSDDWVEPDMYEKMYMRAIESGSDIVSCNFIMEKGKGESEIMENFDDPNPRMHINHNPQNTWWTLWSRLIRRSLILKYNILPVAGMNMWEDVYVNLRAYYYANSLSHVPEAFYHYDVSREGRIVSRSKDDDIIQQRISCISKLEEFFNSVGFDAGEYLSCKKCGIKSVFVRRNPPEYNNFVKCFPEIVNNPYLNNVVARLAWRMAAKGFFLPHKILFLLFHRKSYQ